MTYAHENVSNRTLTTAAVAVAGTVAAPIVAALALPVAAPVLIPLAFILPFASMTALEARIDHDRTAA